MRLASIAILLGMGVWSSHLHAEPTLPDWLPEAQQSWQELYASLQELDVVVEHITTTFPKPSMDSTLQSAPRVNLLRQRLQRSAEQQVDLRTAFFNEPDTITPMNVLGINSRYRFTIARSNPNSSYVIHQISLGSLWPDSFSTKLVTETTTPAEHVSYVDAMYTIEGESIPAMLTSKAYQFQTASRVSTSDGERVRLVFLQKVVLGDQQDVLTSELSTQLDPNRNWIVTDWTDRNPQFERTTTLDYQPGVNGLPFPKLITSRLMMAGGHEAQRNEQKFGVPVKYAGQGHEAFLSHYGLPEPDGWQFPWWGWPLVVGGLATGLRVGLLWWRARSARNVADR